MSNMWNVTFVAWNDWLWLIKPKAVAVRFFILDIYFEYIFSFRLLERILKFDYVRSEEFTEEDRRAQEDFKNFGFI